MISAFFIFALFVSSIFADSSSSSKSIQKSQNVFFGYSVVKYRQKQKAVTLEILFSLENFRVTAPKIFFRVFGSKPNCNSVIFNFGSGLRFRSRYSKSFSPLSLSRGDSVDISLCQNRHTNLFSGSSRTTAYDFRRACPVNF